MFYSYTGGEHKNMFVRFSLKINASSSYCYLSKFYCRKEAWSYAKVIYKKKEDKEKKLRKNGHNSVRDI